MAKKAYLVLQFYTLITYIKIEKICYGPADLLYFFNYGISETTERCYRYIPRWS